MEKMKENHGGAWKEEKDDRKQEKSTDVSLKCLTAARSWELFNVIILY